MLSAKRDKRIDIQRTLNHESGARDKWFERHMFVGLHQAQMARWQLQSFIAMDGAEDRGAAQPLPEQGLVFGARHPVEDDARSPVCCALESLRECAGRL